MERLSFHLRRGMVIGMGMVFLSTAVDAQPVDEPEFTAQEAAEQVREDTPETLQEGHFTWGGSLMFTQARVDRLMKLYQAHLDKLARGQQLEEKNIIRDTLRLREEPEEITEESYRFSLNSIVYDDARNWSIWVNGRRYPRQEALDGFTIGNSRVQVTDVSERQVTYVWTPHQQTFDLVQGRWDQRQRVGEQEWNPQVARNSRVVMDSIGRKVTVTLRPNQTFVSDYMSVMEGVHGLRSIALPPQMLDEAFQSGEVVQEEDGERVEELPVGDTVLPLEEDPPLPFLPDEE